MPNLFVPGPDISGPPATGPTDRMATSGPQAPGCARRHRACFGRQPGGDGKAVTIAFMRVTGDHKSATTVGSATDSATQEKGLRAASGEVTSFSITLPSLTSTRYTCATSIARNITSTNTTGTVTAFTQAITGVRWSRSMVARSRFTSITMRVITTGGIIRTMAMAMATTTTKPSAIDVPEEPA